MPAYDAVINGVKVTQFGENENTGVNVIKRLFVDCIEITPGSSGSPIVPVESPAHGLTTGDCIYYDGGTIQYELAQANSVNTTDVMGVVQVVDADSFNIITSGVIELSGLTPGAIYYLSATNAGETTTTAPTAPNFEAAVYRAYSTNQAVVNIQLPLVGA